MPYRDVKLAGREQTGYIIRKLNILTSSDSFPEIIAEAVNRGYEPRNIRQITKRWCCAGIDLRATDPKLPSARIISEIGDKSDDSVRYAIELIQPDNHS